MVNRELLDQALAWIEANPENWDQKNFVTEAYDGVTINMCGTTFCLAGAALHLANRTKVIGSQVVCVDKYGRTGASWDNEASKLLGLNDFQSDAIFYAITDDFKKFKAYVNWILDHPNLDPEDVWTYKATMLGEEIEPLN